MSKFCQFYKEKKYRTILFSVFLIGICTHGSRIFTSYYAHDDSLMKGVGTTYTSGRWFLQALYKLQMTIMGSSINTKGFLGIVVLALLAVICCLLVYGLELKSGQSCILLSSTIVTFPYVASLLSYTYTAPHYCIATIMSLLAAILIQSGNKFRQKICRTTVGIVLLGLSMAIYQTTICAFIAYLAVMAFKSSLETESETWKNFIFRCIRYLFSCIAGCSFYYLSNKAVLSFKGFSMSGYQGLNHMSEFTLQQILSRIALAYKEFFYPAVDQNYSFYITPPVRLAYYLIILCFLFFSLIFIIDKIKNKKYSRAIQLFLIICTVPLAVNSMFLSADTSSTNIYSLMMFSQVMIFVYLIYAIEKLGDLSLWISFPRCRKTVYCYALTLLIYISVYFGYVTNICYTKAAIQQEQTIQWFNRLIIRIQSVEGYSPSMPVAYINEWNKNPESLWISFINSDDYRIAAYDYDNIINLYNWENYMQMWCGYMAPRVSQETLSEYLAMPEVQEMPSYPSDGSVKIINGVIVIKFADKPYS